MRKEYFANAIALYQGKITLVERLTFPKGWAIPGGRINPIETAEDCAKRKIKEETNLDFIIEGEGEIYKKLDRDSREDKLSFVYHGTTTGELKKEKGKNSVFLLDPKDIDKNSEKFVLDHYDKLIDWYQINFAKMQK